MDQTAAYTMNVVPTTCALDGSCTHFASSPQVSFLPLTLGGYITILQLKFQLSKAFWCTLFYVNI